MTTIAPSLLSLTCCRPPILPLPLGPVSLDRNSDQCRIWVHPCRPENVEIVMCTNWLLTSDLTSRRDWDFPVEAAYSYSHVLLLLGFWHHLSRHDLLVEGLARSKGFPKLDFLQSDLLHVGVKLGHLHSELVNLALEAATSRGTKPDKIWF